MRTHLLAVGLVLGLTAQASAQSWRATYAAADYETAADSYVFGVHLTSQPPRRPSGIPIFLPGTLNAREAAVFELNPGDRREVGVLRLRDTIP